VPAASTGLEVWDASVHELELWWNDNSNNEAGFNIVRLDPGEDMNNPAARGRVRANGGGEGIRSRRHPFDLIAKISCAAR
jgi:hypothetical protein